MSLLHCSRAPPSGEERSRGCRGDPVNDGSDGPRQNSWRALVRRSRGSQRRGTRVALPFTMRSGWPVRSVLVVISCLALLAPSLARATPVEVRFLEGLTRGFLILRSTTGQTVAQGDLIQTA